MGCGASQEQQQSSTPQKGARTSDSKTTKKGPRLAQLYNGYRCQVLVSFFQSAVGEPSTVEVSSLLRMPSTVPAPKGEKRVLSTSAMADQETAVQRLLSTTLPAGFTESEEVTVYDSEALLSYLNGKNPLGLVIVEAEIEGIKGHKNAGGAVKQTQDPAANANGIMGEANFDEEAQLTEDQMFDKMVFIPAPSSRAPSSVSGKRRQQYQALRETDDIDATVGYANAGYIATEPSMEKLQERIKKGATKAMLNGVTADDVVEGTCLRFGASDASVAESPFVIFSASAQPSLDGEANGKVDQNSPAGSPRPMHDSSESRKFAKVCGPVADPCIALFNYIQDVGEASDLVEGLAADAAAIAGAELSLVVNMSSTKAGDEGGAVSCDSWAKPGSACTTVRFPQIEEEIGDENRKLLLHSAVVECCGNRTSERLVQRWSKGVLPWLIDQYRVDDSSRETLPNDS